MSTIVLFEDIWGDPLAELAEQHSVIRTPGTALPQDVPAAVVEAIVVRNRTQVDQALLAALPSLKIVARAGVGLDNIDLAACDARRVVVMSPRGANATSVAEHAVALALAISKRLIGNDASVRRGDWDRRPVAELSGGTWGVVGAGATGLATARLAQGLGMTTIAYDPYADPAVLAANGLAAASLEQVAAESAVVSVHLPATPETTGLIGDGFFARATPGLIVVNVGRGEVVDESALQRALLSGRVRGAGLDVRVNEPPGPSELDDLSEVVYSPHVAGITTQAQQRIMAAMASDVAKVLGGAAADHAVGAYRVAA